MKKLVCAAVVATLVVGCMTQQDDASTANREPPEADSVAVEQVTGKAVQPVSAEAVKPAPQRQQITPEQRQKMREQREKFMAERKAKMESQVLEIVKKYVPEEEKAKVLVKELQDAMMSGRRNMMRRPMKPDEAK